MTDCPDILADARAALVTSTNAGKIFVLPAGAFADFRLDALNHKNITAEHNDKFSLQEKNGHVYASMRAPWYDLFTSVWNDMPYVPMSSVDDPGLYLCMNILSFNESPEPVEEEDFALIRKCMDLPYLRRTKDDKKFTPLLGQCVYSLRASNARALALSRNRYAIRACAAISLTFFRSFSTSFK